jgi:hypothetical protein
MAELLTVCGTLLAAVLAYVLGARQDRKTRLHDERIAATSAFCHALMAYRGAQINRWHAERNAEAADRAGAPSSGSVDADGDRDRARDRAGRRDEARAALHEARAAVRDTKTAVWGCYFRVVLVVDHAPASHACRAALEAARELRYETDAATLDAAGQDVRELAESFVREVALKLGIKPASLAVAAAATRDGAEAPDGDTPDGRPTSDPPRSTPEPADDEHDVRRNVEIPATRPGS